MHACIATDRMKMSLKLLAHVWAASNGATIGKRPTESRVVEERAGWRWNPLLAPASPRSDGVTRQTRTRDPVWAETEPWYHD